MLEHNGDKWGDKVRIIGLSIDDTYDIVASHVKSKKWTTVEHYQKGVSESPDIYGVSGVPHVVLVDTSGTIVFMGHPAERNLE